MNPGLDSAQIEATSSALLAFFRQEVLQSFPTAGFQIIVSRNLDMAFNAVVETATNEVFWIELNDGCVDTIFRALNSNLVEDLEVAVGLSEQLFGDKSEIDAILNAILNCAVTFILLHEYSHIVCGHFHATDKPDDCSARTRTLQEIGEQYGMETFGLSFAGFSPTQVNKVFELEADAAAYELLIEIATDVFLATPAVEQAISRRKRAADLSLDDKRAIQRMTFYACSLVAALTEGVRVRQGHQSNYPSALTRMLSLCAINLVAFLPGAWKVEEFVKKLKIDDTTEQILYEQIVPTIGSALDFCWSGCKGVDIELRLRYDVKMGTQSFARAFGRDFANLVTGRDEKLATAPGREFAALQIERKAMLPAMASFRQASWWNVA